MSIVSVCAVAWFIAYVPPTPVASHVGAARIGKNVTSQILLADCVVSIEETSYVFNLIISLVFGFLNHFRSHG